ncbi:MAG: isochorismatase family protein [Actinobacteria bacterium]|nr:isochorismatase family protein [Actinomycetota bacterium]
MAVEINPKKDALVLIDPQICFMPGGVLAVPGGDKIFDVINPLTKKFRVVAASADWHPPNHISFKERSGPWPPHCIQMREDANFHPKLDQSNLSMVVRKGFNPDKEQYTAFDEVSQFGDMLKARGINRIFVGGVATDYCVHDSVIGALKEGLDVYVLTDAIRGINVKPGDEERALEDMKEHGAELITSKDIVEKTGA